MSRKKLSARDRQALNRGKPITVYPAGGGPAQIRNAPAPRTRTRRKDA